MDSAGRRRTLRSIGRASESSGFEAACEAALRVVEGGRVPDDATVDVLARRIAGGGGVFLIAFIFRKSRDKSFGFHDDCFAS